MNMRTPHFHGCIIVTAFKANSRFAFCWGFDSEAEAKQAAVKWLRKGRSRKAVIERGPALIWSRG
jgi:hypothetical protein